MCTMKYLLRSVRGLPAQTHLSRNHSPRRLLFPLAFCSCHWLDLSSSAALVSSHRMAYCYEGNLQPSSQLAFVCNESLQTRTRKSLNPHQTFFVFTSRKIFHAYYYTDGVITMFEFCRIQHLQ